MNMVMNGNRSREKKSIYDYSKGEIKTKFFRFLILNDTLILSEDELKELEDSKKVLKEIFKHEDLVEKYILGYTNSEETLQRLAEVESEVEEKLNEIFKDDPKRLGFCHTYWAEKKRILKEEYGIEWFTPAECHPFKRYD